MLAPWKTVPIVPTVPVLTSVPIEGRTEGSPRPGRWDPRRDERDGGDGFPWRYTSWKRTGVSVGAGGHTYDTETVPTDPTVPILFAPRTGRWGRSGRFHASIPGFAGARLARGRLGRLGRFHGRLTHRLRHHPENRPRHDRIPPHELVDGNSQLHQVDGNSQLHRHGSRQDPQAAIPRRHRSPPLPTRLSTRPTGRNLGCFQGDRDQVGRRLGRPARRLRINDRRLSPPRLPARTCGRDFNTYTWRTLASASDRGRPHEGAMPTPAPGRRPEGKSS
jgi:hypothetical protein